VQAVEDAVALVMPASTCRQDLNVEAPTPVPVDFVFTALSPDTPSIRESVINNLRDLFRNDTAVCDGLSENAYECAIFSAIDLNTGVKINSFTLSEPIGDIAVLFNEIPVLGAITFDIQ
jgi:uncharacterized phage protein gp47/JayE